MEMEEGATQGLSIVEPISDTETKNRMFFKKEGGIGVNTINPKVDFEVNGILGSASRIGTHKLATIPADGCWHDILTELDGCVAFEIVAQVGKQKTGKYALMHAHALSTFGKSHSRIRKTQAHYGWWWNKIALRWKGSTYNYSLQMKTRSNYGNEEVKYYITKLWDNDILSLFNQ